MMKEKALVDISVLLIFFNRPEPFSLVFEQVKKARPSRLFLYQDGPRDEKDLEGIKRCRDIAADIDWECDVHTFYQHENKGCDPSEYIAQKWAFSHTDKCIVIEDDDVPVVSFFQFCKELLDRYEHDPRVWMISGFNHEEVTHDADGDYFFTEVMSIWGWATWKRVVDTWDGEYGFLDDPEKVSVLEKIIREKKQRSDFLDFCRQHKSTGKPHYETILWASMLLNNGVAIMATRNMINNIGVSADSTHFAAPAHMLPRGYRRIFTMGRHDVEFPLRHPVTVIANKRHKDAVYRILAWDRPMIKVLRSFEEFIINLRYGNFRNINNAVNKRIKKLLHKTRG